jgi:replicative DNA helicase
LLGALLIENAAFVQVSGFLRAEHFDNAVHGRIYAAIGELIERGQGATRLHSKACSTRTAH